MSHKTVVAALAGRRVDQPNSLVVRFPASSVARVRSELSTLLSDEQVGLLVCSAASGADLLALQAADALGISFRIVLPFEPDKFRRTSVVDRSAEWGELYDRLVQKASSASTLLILRGQADRDDPYALATESIINEASAAALPNRALAIEVWEGESRGRNDYVEQFRRLAQAARMRERVILTR